MCQFVAVIGMYNIPRYNAVERIIKSVIKNIIKSANIFQNTLKKYESNVGVKEIETK